MKANKSFRNSQSGKISDVQIDSSTIQNMFELQFHYELFMSRCQDTGEKPDVEKAKMFKQSYNKINSKKHPEILNLYSMRLGVNTIMKLISILETQKFKTINLADNSISEYGMHAVKSLINSSKIQSLNIASNMISEIGLSLVLQDLIKNGSLKILDIGIMQGSIRKNSIGIDGARCIAAILLQNKTLQCLKLEDNDIGINGAQIISIPLKRNKILKDLKVSQNLIKTQGAEYILQNAIHLECLDLGKNFIKSSIGPSLERYLETNKNLKKLNLQLNQLLADGCKILFQGVVNSTINQINIKGNGIGDRGIHLISQVLVNHGRVIQNLKTLDISSNQLTEDAIEDMIIILDHLQLSSLNISKNNFGDEGMIQLMTKLKDTFSGQYIEKIDFSNCKLSDKSFLLILESLNSFEELKHIRCLENYISEKYEKIYVELLKKNQTLISLNLQGNRLSLSGLKGIKRIIDRNLKHFEEKQPKKMKSQIYNMKQKQKKVKQAQDKLEKQKTEIMKLEDVKNKLQDNLTRVEKEEREKRYEHQETIRKRMENIEKLTQTNEQKIQNLEKLKRQKQGNLEKLNGQLGTIKERRMQLQYQLNIIRNQGQLIEQEFKQKMKQIK